MVDLKRFDSALGIAEKIKTKGGNVMKTEKEFFVNVYFVTREFGGHEEGGWYYDNHKFIESKKVNSMVDATRLENELKEKYSHEAYGDIHSVRGGIEVRVYTESEVAESETLSKPEYE